MHTGMAAIWEIMGHANGRVPKHYRSKLGFRFGNFNNSQVVTVSPHVANYSKNVATFGDPGLCVESLEGTNCWLIL